MVIPLHDDNPSATRPYVTVGLMIACALAYVLHHLLLTDYYTLRATLAFGVIPAALTGAADASDVSPVPPYVTVLTSMFLHGSFWHLAGNMLYLWIFGNNVEDAMGHVRFVFFYLLCGVAAVAAQVLPNPGSVTPMIGASGAISGVLGAYFLLYPRARVLLGIPVGFLVIAIGRFPAKWVLLSWFVLQLLLGLLAAAKSDGEAGGIAFGAHIGGFIAGAALIAIFKRSHVPLWRPH